MNYKAFMERIERMSDAEFQEVRKTDEYRALNRDPSVREEFLNVLKKRRSNDRKRWRILEAVYENPIVFEWIKDMENYRDLRIKQAWLSIAIREGNKDERTYYAELDQQRRGMHNRALAAFCRLVESTSLPGTTRDNLPPKDNLPFITRDEQLGDLYEGPLMIPSEEPDKYGNHVVRQEMTTGMFQFLKLIEQTPRGDWDIARKKVIEKIKNDPEEKIPQMRNVQIELQRTVRAFGMSDSPDKDEFSTDLFDDRDNKFKKSKRSIYDGLEFGGE